MEIILVLGCLFGNVNSCTTGGTAYFQYTGINKMVDEYGKKNLTLSYIVTIVAVANEQRIVAPLIRHKLHAVDLELKPDLALLTYKTGF